MKPRNHTQTARHLAVTLALGSAVLGLILSHTVQASLVGYWNFNEGTGTTLSDFSANNNGGTLIAGGGGLPSWVPGHTGMAGDYALKFQGWTDYVRVPHSASLATITSTFTIALWARADYKGYYPYLLETSDDTFGNSRNWFFQGDQNGGDQMYVWSDPVTAWRKGLGFTVPDGWRHYAFTYSGGTLTPYVDGVAKAPISVGANWPTFSSTLLIGGKGQDWTSWEGPIDDVIFLNNAVTANEVGQIMNGTHPAMLRYWTGGGASDNWTDADNWGGAAQGDGKALVFDTSNRLTNTNDFAANTHFKGIRFLSTAGAFTVKGSSVHLTGNVVNESASTETIALTSLVLDGTNRTFDAAAGNISVRSTIAQVAGQKNGIVKSGNYTLTLSGTNTYSGPTIVNLNAIAAGSRAAFSTNSVFTVAAGATLDLAGYDNAIAGLTGSGTVGSSVGAAVLTVNNDAMDYQFDGVLQDGGTNSVLGVTKQGSGALTLTSANTYTGPTTLRSGTLSISQACLADTADVYLTAGATLQLNSGEGVIDVIRSLYIDGRSQQVGTWGEPSSGADHESALIKGKGKLMVMVRPAMPTLVIR